MESYTFWGRYFEIVLLLEYNFKLYGISWAHCFRRNINTEFKPIPLSNTEVAASCCEPVLLPRKQEGCSIQRPIDGTVNCKIFLPEPELFQTLKMFDRLFSMTVTQDAPLRQQISGLKKETHQSCRSVQRAETLVWKAAVQKTKWSKMFPEMCTNLMTKFAGGPNTSAKL